MNNLDALKSNAGSLKLNYVKENLEEHLKAAQTKNQTYLEFLSSLFEGEVKHKLQKAEDRRIKE